MTTTFNILIIGRSGSGKSATTKLLTSNPEIKVANSLKEVTTDVNFYDGTSFEVNGQFIRFRILDIPGLDKINSRVDIREKILTKLQQYEVSLNAIIYVSSMTERDTIDENKLFQFLQQLPWKSQMKKEALIPIFTKYDNLFIDAHQDDIAQTKEEYGEMFKKLGYEMAWSKRIYWINQTKSLDFKLKCYPELKQKYDKQIERLVKMIKKNQHVLTAKDIREIIQQEDRYILKKLFCYFEKNQVSFKKDKKSHNVILKVQVEPQTFEQSMAAVSASSIGIFISKVCQKEVPMGFSLILMSVPITIAILKLASDWFVYHDKKVGQNASGEWIMRSYQHICQQINAEMEREWQQFNTELEFNVIQKNLYCRVPIKAYKFFDVSSMSLKYEDSVFKREKLETHIDFMMPVPKFQEQLVWNPQIIIEYEIKRFDEEHVLKEVEKLRKEFCGNI